MTRLATEANLRRLIAPVLQRLHGFGVETATLPGVPDVNHVGGWMELKVFMPWPADRNAVVRLREELKPTQRAWLMQRARSGGRGTVLVAAGATDEWFLYDGVWAARHLGHCTERDCRDGALRYWVGKLNLKELEELIR